MFLISRGEKRIFKITYQRDSGHSDQVAKGSCYDLNLKCPSQARVFNTQYPACGTILKALGL